MLFENLTFSFNEIFSLLGLGQTIYVLVYMFFRAGEIKRAIIPVLYFLILGSAFFVDLSYGFLAEGFEYYDTLQWAVWALGPPFSVLLIVQIARIFRTPRIFNLWILLLVPASWGGSVVIAHTDQSCAELILTDCRTYYDALKVFGLISGAIALVSIWFRRGMMDNLYREKAGQDRYWLILTLIVVNIFLLIAVFLDLTGTLPHSSLILLRTVLGIALVYLSGTSLFRIYPKALILVDRLHARDKDVLSDSELGLARKIEDLMNLDKVYHDPTYSRAQLAQELDMSEAVISKVINNYFQKSFPQLLNERRVEDAKRLLMETDVSVRVVASEVGFNSVSSFNRVFRDMTGVTPSGFRSTTQIKSA